MPTYQKTPLIIAALLILMFVFISIELFCLFEVDNGIRLEQPTITKEDNNTLILKYTLQRRSIDWSEDEGLYIIIPHTNSNWYQIKMNNFFIDEVGSRTLNSYIEEYVGVMYVNNELIETDNTITMTLKSQESMDYATSINPLVCTQQEARRINFWGNSVPSVCISIVRGMLFCSFCIFLILYFVEGKAKIFLIYSLASIFASFVTVMGDIYQYLNVSLLMLLRIKTTAIMLLLIMLIEFAKLHNEKPKKLYKAMDVICLIALIASFLATNSAWDNYLSTIRDVVVLTIIFVNGSLIFFSFFKRQSEKNTEVDIILLFPIPILAVLSTVGYRELLTSFAFCFIILYFAKTIADELIGNKEKIKQLYLDQSAMRKKARRDDLTGFYNQKVILEKIEEAPINSSIVVIDIDKLKKINDTFGHNIGTKAIELISNLLAMYFKTEKIGRYGGDEFIVISDKKTACILKCIEYINKQLKTESGKIAKKLEISVSAGVAIKEDNETFEETLERADQKMYANKQQSVNDCCL